MRGWTGGQVLFYVSISLTKPAVIHGAGDIQIFCFRTYLLEFFNENNSISCISYWAVTGPVQSSPAVQNFKLAESSNKNQGQKAKCCRRMVAVKINIIVFFLFFIHNFIHPPSRSWLYWQTNCRELSTIWFAAYWIVKCSCRGGQRTGGVIISINPPPLNPAVVRSFLRQIMWSLRLGEKK